MLERYINREIENNIYELARDFAIRIVNMYKYLVENNKEYIMSKQLLFTSRDEIYHRLRISVGFARLQ